MCTVVFQYIIEQIIIPLLNSIISGIIINLFILFIIELSKKNGAHLTPASRADIKKLQSWV